MENIPAVRKNSTRFEGFVKPLHPSSALGNFETEYVVGRVCFGACKSLDRCAEIGGLELDMVTGSKLWSSGQGNNSQERQYF